MDAIITGLSIRSAFIRRALGILRNAALLGLCLLSLALIAKHIVIEADWIRPPFDWTQFDIATQRLDGESLYAWEARGSFEYSYRYSPLFAYVMVPFVALGPTIWRLLHLAVLRPSGPGSRLVRGVERSMPGQLDVFPKQ